ncbi:hypothetical protein CANCADRAFT_1867 [Tortispora caseinolytica NRRL Y-17796]|uniref:nicotinamidase n=1 Tax=Tortispora caseinolytica NRRL Y-17796 TaxID=767744 RepID=A0A1E4TEE6_9ASCO|nr:hypothetical protein CANCADRAFT_1867 [Tortispora caseinolytica NRRL Y-17796]
MKRCLFIVDMQEDFLPPNGALAVNQGRDIIPRINELAKSGEYDLTVMSRDWHPKGHISFASAHAGAKAYETVIDIKHPSGKGDIYKERLWPDHCVQGSSGADFAPELDFAPDYIVNKAADREIEQYSAFCDVWGITETELDSYLKAQGVTDIDVVGVAYDYCVSSTARDAAKYGYKTRLIRDCTKAVDPASIPTVEKQLTSAGVELV